MERYQAKKAVVIGGTSGASTRAPTRPGAIRRFFNAWRRWEKLMDYGPYDYALDRIGELESRVMELERARNAANQSHAGP
jgi:hypothetical protein